MAKLRLLISFAVIYTFLSKGVSGIQDEENYANPEGERLMLTPLIEAGKIKEAQEAAQVTEIKELKNITSYAGYLTVNKEHNANLFFWFFLAQNDFENAPVVLWLQGGPGRSSMRGLLMENGPFDIEPGYLVKREATWVQDHSVIYLDNPVGSGFSEADILWYHKHLSSIGADLYQAVLQFFQLFPTYQKNDFYIAGQSYGGKYVPTIAHLIHTKNPEAKEKINLIGIAIGNGLVDPETQFHYSEYLYQVGLINSKGKYEMETYEKKLLQQTKEKKWTEAYQTYTEILLYNKESVFGKRTGFKGSINILEPRPSAMKELHMSKYISQPEIRRAIHAGNQTFRSSTGYIPYLLREDLMQTVAPLVSELIDNYKVLIYSGQLDIIIPYRTTVNYLKKLTFKGVEGFDDAERRHWYVNNTLAGYVTQIGNLTEVMVRNAGHSATEDQIVWATDMLYRFTRNLWFVESRNATKSV